MKALTPSCIRRQGNTTGIYGPAGTRIGSSPKVWASTAMIRQEAGDESGSHRPCGTSNTGSTRYVASPLVTSTLALATLDSDGSFPNVCRYMRLHEWDCNTRQACRGFYLDDFGLPGLHLCGVSIPDSSEDITTP